VVSGSPGELTKQYWPDAMVRIGAEDVAALDTLASHEGVVGYERSDHTAVVRLDSKARIPDLVHVLSTSGARVTRVEPHEPTLEDLYFAVRHDAGRSRLGAVDGSSV
jgi:hypothetical protein